MKCIAGLRLEVCAVLVAAFGLVGSVWAADAGGRRPAAVRERAEVGTATMPAATQRGADAANPLPLGRFLDANGGLELPPGFSGSIDPSGFAMVSKPGEAPRFAAKNAVDDLARWDPRFGQAIGCNGTVYAAAAFPDGRIAIGGEFTECGNVLVSRVAIWNPSTGVFLALGTGAANGVNGGVHALAIAGSDVFVGGFFSQAGASAASNVARFDTGTQSWSALGVGAANGVNNGVNALSTDGTLVYVGGGFQLAGGALANNVALFNTGTQTWSSLGSGSANGVNGEVRALAIGGSDVFVGGFFSQAGASVATNVARFNTGTQSWSPLGTGAANGVTCILAPCVFALEIVGTEVYVGGFFTQAGGASANRIARFNASAQTWSTLGSGAANGVNSFGVLDIVVAGSDVYVSGDFTLAGGVTSSGVARFDTTAQMWSPLGSGSTNGVSGTAWALAIGGGDVYVGGTFPQAGGAAANGVARFNPGAQTWSSLGAGASGGLSSTVYAIAISGSDVYVGGAFTQAGSIAANFVARFSASTQEWSSLGTGAANGLTCVDRQNCVVAIAVSGSDVYVAGFFSQAGGAAANNVARFNTNSQAWSSLGTGAANGLTCNSSFGTTCARAIVVAGSDIYVGGAFTHAGGAPANNVARFNTSSQVWSSLGTGTANGVSSLVRAVAIAGSDVYVGGFFDRAGTVAANNVARFNTSTQTWSSLGSGAANGVSCSDIGSAFTCVGAVAVAGSDVYVGGTFPQAGGVETNGVARFSASTQTWSPLGAGSGNGLTCNLGDTCVRAIAVAGSDVYVGGAFTQAGGASANNVARFNTSTQIWSSLGTGAANGVNFGARALAIGGSDVFVGGSFTEAGPNSSFFVARYDARRESTSTIASSSGSTVIANSTITFTGSVETTSFSAQPGTVEFLDNGAVIPACANQALVGGLDTRTATCTISALRVGSHSVFARYKGDSLNFIGTSDPITINIVAPNFAFSPATLPAATFNTPGYSSGTITISTAAGTGVISPVTLQVQDPGLLPPGLTSAPLANGLLITGTPTQAGTFTFTVRATDSSTTSATGGHFSSDRQYSIVVARAAQNITPITRVDAVPLDGGVAFADGDFLVQASASSALPVVIDSLTPAVCTVGPPGATVRPLQLGTCTLRARQVGNTNFEPAPDVLRTFQVKATPDVIIDSSPNPSLLPVPASAPDAIVLTASVATPASGTPTGTMRFLRAGNTLAGCAAQPLSGSGGVATATCTTSSLVRGANTITAQYSGDALNVGATSNVHTHTLNVVTSVGIATITPNPCVVGLGCTVAVAVAASQAAAGTPPGSVQVASSTGGSCTVTLSAGGGSCPLTATTAGTGTVTATYLGSPPWLASPAATQGHPFVATVDELFGNGFEPASGGVR